MKWRKKKKFPIKQKKLSKQLTQLTKLFCVYWFNNKALWFVTQHDARYFTHTLRMYEKKIMRLHDDNVTSREEYDAKKNERMNEKKYEEITFTHNVMITALLMPSNTHNVPYWAEHFFFLRCFLPSFTTVFSSIYYKYLIIIICFVHFAKRRSAKIFFLL